MFQFIMVLLMTAFCQAGRSIRSGREPTKPKRSSGSLFSFLAVWIGTVAIPATFGVIPTEIIILKNSVAEQIQPDAVEPAAAAFAIEVTLAEPAPLSRATFSKGSVSGQLSRDDALNLSFLEEFADFAALESKYTAGTYNLAFSGGVEGSYPFNLQSGQPPSMPRITDFTSLQSVTEPENVLIQWTRSGAQADDILILVVFDASENFVYVSPIPGEPGSLNGFSTEIRVPLPAGQQLTGILTVLRITDLGFFNGIQTTVAVGRSAILTFSIDTRINQQVAPWIRNGPANVLVEAGSPFTLSVSVNADAGQPLNYLWTQNRNPVQTGEKATFTVEKSRLEDAGDYRVTVSNSAGEAKSEFARVVVIPRPLPVITQQPLSQDLLSGEPVRLGVLVERPEEVTYTWRRNGQPIPGADQPSLVVPGNDPTATAGHYDTVLSRDGQSVTSETAVITVNSENTAPTPTENRLRNLSLRARVGSGAQSVIVGFVLKGQTPKQVLLRGIGPGLIKFAILNTLADPFLQLRQPGLLLTSNNDYAEFEDTSAIEELGSQVGAFPLDRGSRDSVLLATIDPAPYTAKISSHDDTVGVAIAEIYEGDLSDTVLTNLSARAFVGTGAEKLIPGISVGGTQPQTFLIRAVGPALETYEVAGFLVDPALSLRSNSGELVAENDNWSTSDNPAEIATVSNLVGAFALEPDSLDAALLVTLEPGNYTVIASGVGNTTGIALVEVYAVPED